MCSMTRSGALALSKKSKTHRHIQFFRFKAQLFTLKFSLEPFIDGPGKAN